MVSNRWVGVGGIGGGVPMSVTSMPVKSWSGTENRALFWYEGVSVVLTISHSGSPT